MMNDVEMLSAIDLKVDHNVSYLEKCAIKTCQYGVSILLLPVSHWFIVRHDYSRWDFAQCVKI